MPSVPERPTDEDVVRFVQHLSPEGRDAFFKVFDMLVEFGLRHAAEHPDDLPELVARAEKRRRQQSEPDEAER